MMNNYKKKMIGIVVGLVFLLISVPAGFAGNQEMTIAINEEGKAVTSIERIKLPPILKNFSSDEERIVLNPLTDVQLASIEGKSRLHFPDISVNVSPSIDVGIITQLNICTFCNGTNQINGGILNQ